MVTFVKILSAAVATFSSFSEPSKDNFLPRVRFSGWETKSKFGKLGFCSGTSGFKCFKGSSFVGRGLSLRLLQRFKLLLVRATLNSKRESALDLARSSSSSVVSSCDVSSDRACFSSVKADSHSAS